MSMIFPINAKRNTENARNYWTTTRRESRRGYDIEYLCEHKTNGAQSRIILSVYNGKHLFYIAELETPESRLVFKLSEYRNIDEPHGSTICIDDVDIYARGSNYKRRTERSMRYLQKYDSMACLVHGLIAAGLVESAEAPTEPETSEGKEDTTTTKTEPMEGTEGAKKTAYKTTDMETFRKAYSAAYTALYDHCGETETDEKERYYRALFDQEAEAIADTVRRFCAYRGDLVSSDREAAAFMIALEAVGAPTDGKTATDGETTTTPETDAQRATEPPKKAIQTGERLYSHPHRHMVTVAGLQDGLVMVIYRGRLYLVSANDLYTDESETTPAMPPQAAESAEKTADDTTHTAGDTTPTEGTQEAPQTAGTSEGGNTTTPPHTEPPRATERAAGSVSQSDRITRPAAPQSHESGEGIQRHHRPPKTAYRAIQSAATIPARYHHAQTTISRGSPKICISWG